MATMTERVSNGIVDGGFYALPSIEMIAMIRDIRNQIISPSGYEDPRIDFLISIGRGTWIEDCSAINLDLEELFRTGGLR